MTMFTRRCSRQIRKWRSEFASGFKIFLSLILLSSFFTTDVCGQIGVAPVLTPCGGMDIQGSLRRTSAAGDWFPGTTATLQTPACSYLFNNDCTPNSLYASLLNSKLFHRVDLQNSTSDDVFTQGSKLFQNPNTGWTWTLQKPTGKDDIQNSFLYVTTDASGNIWLLVTGDRKETNGTSYLDIELYQNTISLNADGSFTSLGPNNGRTVGDLDITLSYTGGGSVASIDFLQWNPDAGAEGGFSYQSITPGTGEAYVATNSTTIDAPCGAFGAATYDPLQFIEAAINVSALLDAQATACSLPFKTVFIKTKASAVPTAELKDFIAPFQISFCVDVDPPVITGVGGTPSNGALGCNPSSGAINAALGTATASDACGTASVTFVDGAVSSSGCARSQTRRFTASDACGNTATVSRTATWTADVTAPTITATGTPANGVLGCNPSAATIEAALGSASATDACGIPTVTPTTGALQSTGCLRSQTRTWLATDACGNTATASRTATWTFDITPPTITANGNTLALGCNPSTATINGALGSASATDACGGATVGTPSDGAIQSNGCLRSQTRTFTATDGCGNTATTSRTATWTFDQTPPTITATGNALNLGCNPTAGTINAALGSASATDACGGATVGTPVDGNVQSSGCGRSQTRTFTATDACGNTATTSRTATWTADATPPVITATGSALALGCNPTSAQINAALGSATASDNCGTVEATPSDGPIVTSGCLRSQTRSWSATDCGGNTVTASRTATWTEDVTPPTITATGTPANGALGCNPTGAAIQAALGSASATDACGGATVGTPSDGTIISSGCLRTQTRTFTATDGCGNTATTSRTATWTSDNTAPTITATGTPANGALGCNPSGAAIEAALGSASATDACGTPTVSAPSDGNVQSSGCSRSQTRTWTATDACGNTATISRTATWTFDITPPTITATGNTLALGCNPSTATINGALGSASATDACGGATVGTPSDGSIISSGCLRSQTRTFTATDACGNTATASRTATWTSDVTAPTVTATGTPANGVLGCNPSGATIEAALGSGSATDACGTPTTTASTAAVQSSGCLRSQTRTFTATDACGNTATTSRTATWTADVTPPTLTATGTPANGVIEGCNPSSATINAALGAASATDACGTATTTFSDGGVVSSGCNFSQTRKWTATDACGNTATTSRTATWQCCPTVLCTYTQGYYGNPNGQSCSGVADPAPNTFTTTALIEHDITALGGTITIGCAGHSVTIVSGDAHCIIDVLPGGGSSYVLTGDYSICNLPDSYLKNGRINNTLLAQTITLTLNTGINYPTLSNFALQANKWLVTADVVECGSNLIKPCTFNCVANATTPVTYTWTVASTPYHVSDCRISQALYDALATKDVKGLLALANSALCGTALPTGVSLDDIAEAEDCINNAFDGCRSFVTWATGDVAPTANSFCSLPSNTTPCCATSPTVFPCPAPIAGRQVTSESFASTDYLKVTAYPNPFKATVKFTISSTVSGQAQLEVYNTMGQRVSIVYNGYLQANRGQVVEYKAPRLGSNLIYILRVGSKQVTGKLLRLE